MIVGFKIFIDLFDVVYTLVVYITYNMSNRDLPDIYTLALGPAAFVLRCIYQANPSCPCYNLYIYPHPWACGPWAQVYISGKSLLPML